MKMIQPQYLISAAAPKKIQEKNPLFFLPLTARGPLKPHTVKAEERGGWTETKSEWEG